MGTKACDRLFRGLEKALADKIAFGESKYEAKKNGSMAAKIYSYKTFNTYLSDCRTFATWAYEKYNCKGMQQALPHIKEFCERPELSAWTQQKYACALSKAYGRNLKEELCLEIKNRYRAQITRSRGCPDGCRHFSETKNAELVEFCKSTGLRRHELQMLEGRDLVLKNGMAYIHVRNGKGGKERLVPVLNNNPLVIERMQQAAGLVWGKVNSHAPIHRYRRDYANARYKQLARDTRYVPRNELYYPRNELAGLVWDKAAMLVVSRDLGHNRLDVIANNYLDY